MVQRKACIRLQNSPQPAFGFQQCRHILRMRPLSDRITFLQGEQVAEPRLPDLGQAAAHQFIIFSQRAVMLLDEQQQPILIRAGKAQTAGDLFCNRPADCGMPVKVPDPLLIHRFTGRFAAIMQQRRPAQHRICRHLRRRADAVLPHIIQMVRIALRAAEHRRQLGQHHTDQIGKHP